MIRKALVILASATLAASAAAQTIPAVTSSVVTVSNRKYTVYDYADPATNLTPGYHVFSVLGTDASGNIRPSNPVMVVVRKPSTDVQAAQQ